MVASGYLTALGCDWKRHCSEMESRIGDKKLTLVFASVLLLWDVRLFQKIEKEAPVFPELPPLLRSLVVYPASHCICVGSVGGNLGVVWCAAFFDSRSQVQGRTVGIGLLFEDLTTDWRIVAIGRDVCLRCGMSLAGVWHASSPLRWHDLRPCGWAQGLLLNSATGFEVGAGGNGMYVVQITPPLGNPHLPLIVLSVVLTKQNKNISAIDLL